MKAFIPGMLFLIGLGALSLRSPTPSVRAAAWAEEALAKEADYIVNCSFTEFAAHSREVQPTDDAYGALNVLRVYDRGPDWVPPGEVAMGAIGLMAAAIQLRQGGSDISRYDQVLERLFRIWILERKQPISRSAVASDAGGFVQRVHYDVTGGWVRNEPANTGVTGQMVSAMWKYSEYQVAAGSPEAAGEWLRQAWPIARMGGEFIRRNYHATYRLVRSSSRSSDLWLIDSTYAAMALRCLERWAAAIGETRSFDYSALADSITEGIRSLKDNGARKSFFRYRNAPDRYRPTYGDRIDQICFVPYETDVLDPGEPFARAVSDWWTNGSDGIRMTYQTTEPDDWRYFGTRLRFFLSNAPESQYLYPGAALQLAKAEWKHAHRTGDPVTLDRARKRFQWARSSAYANLWLGDNGVIEAEVPNGLVDWRDGARYANIPGHWARFVDTSAYFIEVTLMLEHGVDTKYVPN